MDWNKLLTKDNAITAGEIIGVFQKGPMQTVTEVMNPERIRETCEKNCHCFDTEFGCGKQLGFCTKQEIEWK